MDWIGRKEMSDELADQFIPLFLVIGHHSDSNDKIKTATKIQNCPPTSRAMVKFQ